LKIVPPKVLVKEEIMNDLMKKQKISKKATSTIKMPLGYNLEEDNKSLLNRNKSEPE
jgi:hypothetical protein